MDLDDTIRRFEAARNSRGTWDDTFQQIAERVLPQAADFGQQRSPGEKRTEKMYDGTAALAAQRAVAAISSFFWPSNQRYQKLSTNNEALNKVHRVKVYMDALTDSLFKARYSPRAAFEAQMGEAALQWFVFGTGLMFVEDDTKGQRISYRSMHLGNTYISEGAGGKVDTVMRCWKWPLRNIEKRWPGKLPTKYRDQLQKRPDDEIEIAHVVMPRDDYSPDRPGYFGWPWASCYFIPADKTLLEEGGYESWPFAVLRYMTSPGEVYGRSPAWLALSNIRVLNTMKRTVLGAAQKVVDPPMLATEDGILGAFSQAPGYLNFGGLDASGRQLVQPLQTGGKIELGLDMMDKEREIISGAFLMDVFRALIENPQMTATQALELLQERATIMSPIGGRLESEGLGPMTERELQLLAKAGQIPEMPPELIEAQGEYRIEYTSPMRKAMRASEGIAITRTLEAVLPLAEIEPSILDPFDLPKTARELADINGYPAKAMRSIEDAAALAEGRKQQQDMQSIVEAAPQVSAAAANLAKMQAAGGVQPGL